MTESPFNADPQMAAMRQDIADRAFRIKMTGWIISGALAIAAIATMLYIPPAALGLAQPLIGVALLAGSALAGIVTMKEAKKLEIDEQFLQSRMQGKNYWGAGYREEVAERGYAGVPVQLQGGPASHGRKHER